MAVIEIRLEAGKLDLLPDAEKNFYITKQIYDLKDLNTRNASFSKQLTVPRNLNNITLLEDNLTEFAAYSNNAYTYVPCEVFMKGYPALNDGRLFVVSEDRIGRTITIVVLGGVVDFFEQLSDKSLSALNFPEYDMDWTLSNLSAFTNTTEGLLIGRNMNFSNEDRSTALSEGEDSDIDHGTDINFMGSWFYFHSITQRILDNIVGFDFDLTELTTDSVYMKLCAFLKTTIRFDNFTAIEGVTSSVRQSSFLHKPFGADDFHATFDTVQVDDPIGTWNPTTHEYDIVTAGYYDINVDLRISSSYPGRQSDQVVSFASVKINDETIFTQQLINFTRDMVNKNTVFLNIGDKVYVELGGTFVIGKKTVYDGYLSVKGSGNVDSNFVRISDYMPNMSQKDFIKEIFKMFNIFPSYENGVIKFLKWDKIPEKQPFDITEFVDTGKPIVTTGSISSYAQTNYMTYSNDEDVISSGLNTSFPMLSQDLTLDKIAIQSKFSGSDSSSYGGGQELSAPLFEMSYSKVVGNKMNTTAGSDEISTNGAAHNLNVGDVIFLRNTNDTGSQGRRVIIAVGSESEAAVDVAMLDTTFHDWEFRTHKKRSIGLRFGLAAQIGSPSTTLREGGSSISGLTMKSVGFPDEIKWSGLKEAYYNNLVDMLRKPLVASFWLRLPNAVFHSLTPLQPVYVQNRPYYINKIEQYNYTKLCRTELIEIKEGSDASPVPSYNVSNESIIIGNWVDGLPDVTQQYNIYNNGAGSQTVDITLKDGTDLSEWSLDKAQVILPDTFDAELITLSFTGSATLGSREVTLNFLNQDGLNIERTARVDVFSDASYNFTPNPMDYGIVEDQNTVFDALLENTGEVSIDFDLSTITGTNAIAFTFVGVTPVGPFTLVAGASQVIQVNFRKNNGVLGINTAQFDVETSTGGLGNTTVQLTAERI